MRVHLEKTGSIVMHIDLSFVLTEQSLFLKISLFMQLKIIEINVSGDFT